MEQIRKLKANEIDVKVGSVTRGGYTLLLYKNARVDMAILDETFGAENWQNKFYEVCGNLYCSLGIKIGGEWIWKDDCGVESAFGDKEKGQASDARKRAGFAWGIGRELYTSPFIYIQCETEYDDKSKSYKIKDADEKKRKFAVSKINYNEDGEIVELVIVDTKGNIAHQTTPKASKSTTKQATADLGGDYVFKKGKYAGKTIAQVYEIDEEYLEWCYNSPNVPEDMKNNIALYIERAGEE